MQPDRQVQRILCEGYAVVQARGCLVGFGSIPLKNRRPERSDLPWLRAHGERAASAAPPKFSARRRGLRLEDQLGELPEVLDGRGEEELVAGTVWAAQSQPVEAEDAL
jgi:hypothetical protein